MPLKITTFLSGEQLCEKMTKGRYFDFILLDIKMENMDGTKIGYWIREHMKNETTLLVYILNHKNYLLELFDVQTFNFIIKPIKREDFNEKLTNIYKKSEK